MGSVPETAYVLCRMYVGDDYVVIGIDESVIGGIGAEEGGPGGVVGSEGRGMFMWKECKGKCV